jgi:hypothetical protein
MKLGYLRYVLPLALISSPLVSVENGLKSAAFFQASQAQPYHISVGAVVFDEQGRIACHHFKEILGHKDVYILMRESMENDETLLKTVHRGLKEEFGMVANPVAFIGSLVGFLPDPKGVLSFDKTTLYIACQFVKWHSEGRDLDDPEASSTIEWIEPEKLIELMQKQGVKFHHRADADESEMIKRALPYIQTACTEA